ncbi:MAG: hypothetical protein P8L83_04295 [Flavobacteriaceae bacterium]|nr:hypothetical protein [Flavobacteriaceae bacterium]
MNRRIAIKQIGLLTGGLVILPYACNVEPNIIYYNLPTIKGAQQKTIGHICNIILPEDIINFPTLESRQEFVLTMVNDCYAESKVEKFIKGFDIISILINEIKFENLSIEEQISFIDKQTKSNDSSSFFLKTLKKYSLLHFESSENYMVDYLNFEFVPGRYLGSVSA